MPPERFTIGWEEWIALPKLGLPALKVKVDTGAKTSALHAFNIKHFRRGEKHYVRFEINPLQRRRSIVCVCEAEVVDKRHVKSSTGHRQRRTVIHTPIFLGEHRMDIQITLTNRDSMGYRMLLGREAMRAFKCLVDPSRSFLQQELSDKAAKALYKPFVAQEGKKKGGTL